METALKYAFMSFSCPDLSFEQMVSTALLYGYNGIEPRISEGHLHGMELTSSKNERLAFRRSAEENGIDICCIATGYSYVDPATVTGNIQNTFRAIELAADVGCKRIRVFGGELPESMSHVEAIPLLVDSLGCCADTAAAYGVNICLETHDSWSNPNNVAKVLRQINHSSIGVNWDIAHPIRQAGYTVEESFQVLFPWLKHVHIHDGIHHKEDNYLEFKPMGDGQFDHSLLVKLLQSHSYDGYLSGEWIDFEDYNNHLPREIKMMKYYEQR